MNAQQKQHPHGSTTTHGGRVFTYTHSAAQYDAAAARGDWSLIHVLSDAEARSYADTEERADDARNARRNPYNA